MGSLKVLISIISLLIISNAAYAVAVQVPEPGSVGLLAVGLVGILVTTRNRNKKEKD